MGTTKNHIFSSETTEMANLLKAIGHPARFEIINLLRTEKTCCGTTIMNLIPLSQSTLSKHLSELKNAAIISCENKGNHHNYTLNENALKKIATYFTSSTDGSKIGTVNQLKTDRSKSKDQKPDNKTPNTNAINTQINLICSTKKISKSNANLKKENHVFKHLLLKSRTL